ncbi:metal-dependent hydrolase of the beta-lactamase superfamily transporter III [Legionella quinlivanii]|uniref:Metal-dependent hydrolase of the beta-lactamase superfamily transporter III n=1 Tax=Legionella quinlivanii TaxID=45073 RepID=A0A0W0Y5A1_9GAMM|nr:MBL fold metallo-hydrolase [Legionella quinlivanii]KTD51830.1 metal-dependent hydrolase of the beta-lactamase superfamily transporter III [Legionella quinlivanii]MCW8452090.1 MBL fold metallo-hydrolase [Legionella quinlivanii]SEF82276.1 Ribonuclease BN, tRNA processing enzyme [Legionella quinlivanii DSM 21216]STY09709.1 metal-dependent hydrolase of the beta-lactamase superfamily transporter III [Legionella quinlivanii]
MSLKMTFLGTGSAFTVGSNNFQSNVLLQLNGESLLIDAGSDVRFALYDLKIDYHNIRSVYISHLHSDHIGGLEWFALSTFFDPQYQGKPNLFVSDSVVGDLWSKSLAGGLSTLPNQRASLQTYFNVHSINKYGTFVWEGITFKLIQMIHVFNDYSLMPCFGLMFEYNSTKIFFTADTQYVPDQMMLFYKEADIIFHDCETQSFPSGVHAHYKELVTIPPELKQKIWLYHYNPGQLPDAKKDGFLGFVARGQSFIF